MDILVFGGTGAMGVPLVKLLSKKDNNIYVITRSKKVSKENVTFLRTGKGERRKFTTSYRQEKLDHHWAIHYL